MGTVGSRRVSAPRRLLALGGFFVVLGAGWVAAEVTQDDKTVAQDQLPTEAQGLSVDWDHIFVGEEPVASVAEAAEYLAFTPVVPDALGAPLRILIHERGTDPLLQDIGVIYDHQTFGRFQLIEGVPQTTQAELELIAAQCTPASGCEVEAGIVTLAGNVRALQKVGSSSTTLTWLKGGIRFDVRGPSETFTAESARQVAETVLAAMASA